MAGQFCASANKREQNVLSRLPSTSKPPVMLPVTSSVGWLVKYALVSDTRSPEELRTLSDWQIRPRILSLGGFASVVSIGGEVKQYQVPMDPLRMQAYNGLAQSCGTFRFAVSGARRGCEG